MQNTCGSFERPVKRTCLALGIVMVPLFSAMLSAQVLPLDSLQRRFVDLRFGMFIHFNMNTYVSGWANARTNPLNFNPTNLNCAQWAAAAKAAKMTYGVLTCKHHDGFTIWPCKQTPLVSPAYTIAQSSVPDSDVVKSFVTAFRAQGLLPGLYMSIFDVAQGIPTGTTPRWTAAQRTYTLGQITELLTNYGQIPIFWFDGYAWGKGHWSVPWQEIRDTIKRLQSNCIIVETNGMTNQHWESDVSFVEEDGTLWLPAVNTLAAVQASSISGDWFWNSTATSGSTLKSVADIVTNHLDKLNPLWCNYQLNCPPNRQGMLDTAIVNRLTAVGAAWTPNLSRAPLPKQPTEIEQPFTPASATATSGTAFNAIDGYNDRNSLGTYQSLWESTGNLPQSVTLDLGKTYPTLNALFYLPRRDGSTAGNITGYQISISSDGTNFTAVTSGTWANDAWVKRVFFPNQACRYVRLTATAVSSGTSAVICDLSVGDTTPVPPAVAVNEEPDVKQAFQMPGMSITTAMGSFNFGPALSGKVKSVSVFNLAGKLMGIKTTHKNSIDLSKDFGISGNVYVIKMKL
jgi:alpha-L-fucosidase